MTTAAIAHSVLSVLQFAKGLRDISGVESNRCFELARDMVDMTDTDGDGYISFNEFVTAFRNAKITGDIRDRLRRAGAKTREVFKALDTNGDGVLSKSEFKRGLDKMGVARELNSKQMEELISVRVHRPRIRVLTQFSHEPIGYTGGRSG